MRWQKAVLILEVNYDIHTGGAFFEAEEGPSEGRLLQEFFRMLAAPFRFFSIRTPAEMGVLITRYPSKFIHISAHGVVDKPTGKLGIEFPFNMRHVVYEPNKEEDLVETVEELELHRLYRYLKGRVIFASACLLGKEEFAKEFVEQSQCELFIGANYRAYWYDLAIFSQLFYNCIFRENKDALQAVRRAKKQYPKEFRGRHFIKVWKPSPQTVVQKK
ncbi:MAG: hypothetical protein ACE5OR_03745 [bacterium]